MDPMSILETPPLCPTPNLKHKPSSDELRVTTKKPKFEVPLSIANYSNPEPVSIVSIPIPSLHLKVEKGCKKNSVGSHKLKPRRYRNDGNALEVVVSTNPSPISEEGCVKPPLTQRGLLGGIVWAFAMP